MEQSTTDLTGLLQFWAAYQHKRASVVGECARQSTALSTYGPKIEQKRIEITNVREKRCGFTHIACAIVLVFLDAIGC